MGVGSKVVDHDECAAGSAPGAVLGRGNGLLAWAFWRCLPARRRRRRWHGNRRARDRLESSAVYVRGVDGEAHVRVGGAARHEHGHGVGARVEAGARDDDGGNAVAAVQQVAGGKGVALGGDGAVGEQRELEGVGREHGGARQDATLVDIDKRLGHVQLAVIAQHRVAHVDERRARRARGAQQRDGVGDGAQAARRGDEAREQVRGGGQQPVVAQRVQQRAQVGGVEADAGRAVAVARVCAPPHGPAFAHLRLSAATAPRAVPPQAQPLRERSRPDHAHAAPAVQRGEAALPGGHCRVPVHAAQRAQRRHVQAVHAHDLSQHHARAARDAQRLRGAAVRAGRGRAVPGPQLAAAADCVRAAAALPHLGRRRVQGGARVHHRAVRGGAGGAVQFGRRARARLPQDHPAPHLRQDDGAARGDPARHHQRVPPRGVRERALPRRGRAAGDPGLHHQRLCGAAQGGAQAAAAQGAAAAAPAGQHAGVPRAAVLLRDAVCGEGAGAVLRDCELCAQALAGDALAQGGDDAQRDGGDGGAGARRGHARRDHAAVPAHWALHRVGALSGGGARAVLLEQRVRGEPDDAVPAAGDGGGAGLAEPQCGVALERQRAVAVVQRAAAAGGDGRKAVRALPRAAREGGGGGAAARGGARRAVAAAVAAGAAAAGRRGGGGGGGGGGRSGGGGGGGASPSGSKRARRRAAAGCGASPSGNNCARRRRRVARCILAAADAPRRAHT
ncbi:hypothetical protein FGB62_32g143 [Gracilaria domingensis]|nr:hypothetical protein FGB62_32g143 [Gracilaria domingensis]